MCIRDRAGELIDFYNLNDDVDPIVTPAYPEAPLEYKQYLITFLTDLLSNLKSPTATSTSFSKFGIKLIVYGGCLEMARYSGLGITEANSILYDAFRITDGDGADLEAFYEADVYKRQASYSPVSINSRFSRSSLPSSSALSATRTCLP